ncbi:MAG TPA: hypothetical protein PLU30_15080 [Verrucomicrobiae bacterium]|nr:hypothetical protein [Verrucomicrobiae bacterium]
MQQMQNLQSLLSGDNLDWTAHAIPKHMLDTWLRRETIPSMEGDVRRPTREISGGRDPQRRELPTTRLLILATAAVLGLFGGVPHSYAGTRGGQARQKQKPQAANPAKKSTLDSERTEGKALPGNVPTQAMHYTATCVFTDAKGDTYKMFMADGAREPIAVAIYPEGQDTANPANMTFLHYTVGGKKYEIIKAIGNKAAIYCARDLRTFEIGYLDAEGYKPASAAQPTQVDSRVKMLLLKGNDNNDYTLLLDDRGDPIWYAAQTHDVAQPGTVLIGLGQNSGRKMKFTSGGFVSEP